jgi:hypothetical protein
MVKLGRFAQSVVLQSMLMLGCVAGFTSAAWSQGYDPLSAGVQGAFQGSAAIGSTEMSNGRDLIPQGAPMQSSTYQLPPPVQQPRAVAAPSPAIMQQQPYYYGSTQGTVRLNPNINSGNVSRLAPPTPPPPAPVYHPAPTYYSQSTFQNQSAPPIYAPAPAYIPPAPVFSYRAPTPAWVNRR